jgi:hypothetical protein
MSDKINEIVEKIYSEIPLSERETFDFFFIDYFGKNLRTYARELYEMAKNTSENWNKTGEALEKIVLGIGTILTKTQESYTTVESVNEKLQEINNTQILAKYNPSELDG